MDTQCKAEQLEFHALGRRAVIGKFDGGRISSDGGGVLLREVERRTHILKQFSDCFADHRNPKLIEHSLESLVKQRVFGLALGYEDLNDHDALLALLSDKADLTKWAPILCKKVPLRLGGRTDVLRPFEVTA